MRSIPLPSLLDTALDRTLIGYGNVGYLARRGGWPDDERSLEGKVAIVTGAKAGLGRATAAGLARLGATVRMAVRGREDGERVKAELEAEVPGARLAVDVLDVSSLADVRAYAAAFEGPLHVLVHNAGVMPPQREVTAEGHERMLATHVLGPHLLTSLLRRAHGARRARDLGRLGRHVRPAAAGRRPRVRARRVQADDRLRPHQARPGRAVGAVGGRAARGRVVVHAMHPGWADTPGVASSLPGFRRLTRPILRTNEQGADTIVWLASADAPLRSTGRFWHDRRERPTHYTGRSKEGEADRRALWDACERLTA